MGQLYLLYESASGYGLFERVKSEEIGISLPEVQDAVTDLKKFSMIVKLKAFLPFKSAEEALENINAVSEGELTPALGHFLEMNLAKKSGKDSEKDKTALGLIDTKLGNAISETLSIKCKSDEVVQELLRGIRLHFTRFITALKAQDLHRAQLGLGHSYSRSKVKFNVHRVDNMIIQAIALLDQLDKDLNTFAMRVREWYGWHFPELMNIVNDNYQYARIATLVKNKTSLTSPASETDAEELKKKLEEIVADESKATQIVEAARMSMGTDLSTIDMSNIEQFATRVVHLSEYRRKLHEYLCTKMNACAPNLSALIGEQVGARLISHAGSLTNLAKYPASTVQILGAEKALFRALKTKGNTPKYGLIFHSTFIGRAGQKNKGRISRYLANKCSIASRIDCFSDSLTNKFGTELKKQVEERLEFYKTGAAPRKNAEVMKGVMQTLEAEESAMVTEDGAADAKKDKKEKKKEKKDKKRKAEEEEEQVEEPKAKKPKVEEVVADVEEDKSEKKKKKKKNKD